MWHRDEVAMTSCWHGIGHILSDCVSYQSASSSRRSHINSGHVAPSPSTPSIVLPRVSRPSVSMVTSRESVRPMTGGSECGRYLVVRPASPHTRSPSRTSSSRSIHRSSEEEVLNRGAGLGTNSQRELPSGTGGVPPLMLLARGFQLPPILSSGNRQSFLYSYGNYVLFITYTSFSYYNRHVPTINFFMLKCY